MRIAIIGSGLGGLATACLFATSGNEVTVFEKNEQLGGRASVLKVDGFTFDMGPSWYLMPEFFEHFFHLLGEQREDFYTLERLDPSYRISFKGRPGSVDFYGDLKRDLVTLEALEPGCTEKLKTYLETARMQYEISTDRFIYKNYDSIFDFFTKEILTDGLKLHVFESMESYIQKQFKSPEVRKILQYTLVFLGSSPARTPALYSLMSHIDFHQGVFYPMGGMGKLPEALERIGTKHGVHFRLNSPVKRILLEDETAKGVELESGETFAADCVISNTDIAFTEQSLLPETARDHSARYWKKRTLAPSALMLYLGMDTKFPSLKHHNLFFCEDWKQTFDEIFERPTWPTDPSLYICAPSVTDPSVAPAGMENIFILVPIAADLEDTEETRSAYTDKILTIIEKELNLPDFRSHIVVQKSFCVRDFKERYNSQGGTALGLAHTLTQTAIFRPNNVSKKVKNLYYVGASTNPGIGMPMVFASAELVYKRLYGIKNSQKLSKLESRPL